MRIAHVRETTAPSGTPWRLAAALDAGAAPGKWLDLEPIRRSQVQADPRLAHNSALHRQPLTTLDALLARGLRVEALGELVEAGDEEWIIEAGDLAFGPPVLQPTSLRDFYAFEGHVKTMWERRGGSVPEAWYRIPIFYFSNVSEIRGPGEPFWCPDDSYDV
jgi:hypothetical protein